MNSITAAWSMGASACVTVALIHLLIWLKDRKSYDRLLFALAALAVAAIAVLEFQMMMSQTPGQFGRWMRWVHVPIFVVVVSIVWFVRSFLQAGRVWLAWSVVAVRSLALILNFIFAPNLNYREITSLRQIEFFGSLVSVPVGVISQRTRVGEFSSLLLLAFVLDASISLWRKGNYAARRRAVIVGGSVTVFVLAGAGHVALIHAGLVTWPYMISMAFLVPVMAMGYALSLDVARSGRLEHALAISQAETPEYAHPTRLAGTAAEFGTWRWDIQADEASIGAEGRALLGFDSAEKVNLARFLGVLIGGDRDSVQQAIKDSLGAGSDFKQEFRIRLRDGATRWIAAHGRLEFNASQAPIAIRGISFDITRRKQAEESFQGLVEAAPNAFLVVGSEGRIVLLNSQTEAIFGYTRQELVGRPVETLIPERFRSDHQDHLQGYFSEAVARSMGMGRDVLGRRKDGSEVPVEMRLEPIETSEGTVTLASITDVTERRKAEREQVMQRNELAHLSRVGMLGELSGALVHELNQPLTSILSNAQAAQSFLAENSIDLNEVREILQDIVDQDRRAREVINRLRMLFRKGEVQFEAIDLNELVLEVLRLMNSELVNHDVKVETELASGVPTIIGDHVQLQQVLINLIVNASDAMTHNNAADRMLRVTTRFEENRVVTMSVADEGCGIPPDQIERVFEPFHTTKAKGMGLGLAVCRTIITAHAGKLWATNNRERGACFHITLPTSPSGAT